MTSMIDLTGLDKAEVLARLFNAAYPRNFRVMGNWVPEMTREEAAKYLHQSRYFDYKQELKIDLSGDTLDPSRYNELHGPGAAEKALAPLMKKGKPWGVIGRLGRR
jgi:hypothetical protein